jgi:hypothetical protein
MASLTGVFTTSGLTATSSEGASGVAPDFGLTVGNVPEPTSIALFGAGLLGAVLNRRRRS